MTVFRSSNQNTQEVKNERKTMFEFSAYVAFNKATNGQTYNINKTQNEEKTYLNLVNVTVEDRTDF